ncbi:hypothetical protein J2S17_003562 [Cytobacillus purgationiresistens]|uniref:Uncharacterized protein n=1 Tax=Cytobacillus purgationiresistens TaxID=863449 RepID=A0ABU0AK79_9BACI|nr:hypothetical protein [Cytobacillus purgationiresistens]
MEISKVLLRFVEWFFDNNFTVPANKMHRTRSNERTVNICFEKMDNDVAGSES